MAVTDQDLAKAVRDAANERLAAGELKPTLRDGLAAQALLDRREEKQRDRNFMLSLARLTSGAAGEPPRHIIEGHAEEVTPLVIEAEHDTGESEDEDTFVYPARK